MHYLQIPVLAGAFSSCWAGLCLNHSTVGVLSNDIIVPVEGGVKVGLLALWTATLLSSIVQAPLYHPVPCQGVQLLHTNP